MQVSIDLCVIPIGTSVSLSEYIAACQKVLDEAGLDYQLQAYGTLISGEWDAVFAAVKQCHQVVHEMGAPRISSTIKAGTRVDREEQSFADKVASVTSKLDGLQ